MAFLRDFEHDLFLSYCHDDNEAVAGETGWVDLFAEQLQIALKQESGQRDRLGIWRDPRLKRAQMLDDVLERAVRGSGVMLLLLSRSYLNSDYCAQERAWFCDEAVQRGLELEVASYRRALPILLRDIPSGEWPEACRGALGFPFHHRDGDEAGWPLDPDSREFRKALRELVGELWILLQKLAGQRVEQVAGEETEAVQEGSPFRVFLAQPPVDLRPIREQLKTALVENGVELLPDMPPPHADADHRKAVEEAVREADLSIHLLGLEPGKAVADGEEKTYPVEQALIGLEHARSQLFLMRDEFDLRFVEEVSYAEFVGSLQEQQRDADRLELVQTSRHQMLDEILAKRRRLAELARRAAAPSDTAAFVDLHPKDWSRAGDLVTFLEGKRVPLKMAISDERALFEQSLKESSLFLVVFGEVARDWVVGRLNRALKLALEQDLEIPMAVYLATPSARGQRGFGAAVEVVDSADRGGPARLEALLERAATAAR